MHRSVACPASVHAGNLGLIFGAVGMGIAQSSMNAAAAVRARREETASATLAHQLRQAVDSAHHWSDIAAEQAAEIERLKADNERLRKIARDQHNDLVTLARRK